MVSIAANSSIGVPPVRLALIGFGRWGRVLMRVIDGSPAATLVRIASSNPEAASAAPAGCTVDRDWRDSVSDPDVQGVVIATPPATHAAIARAALNAGKAVLIEKPLTLDLAEAEALLAHAERLGAVVLVDHVHLFHPAYRRLKEEVRAAGGPLRLRSVNGGPGPDRADTPVLWDWGAHEAALALDLVGADAEGVSVSGLEAGGGAQQRLSFSFPGGIRAEAAIGIGFPTRRRLLAVETKKGAWAYDEQAPSALVRLAPHTSIDDVQPGETPPGAVSLDVGSATPLNVLMATFATAIGRREADLEGLRLGVRVVRLLSRIEKTL